MIILDLLTQQACESGNGYAPCPSCPIPTYHDTGIRGENAVG